MLAVTTMTNRHTKILAGALGIVMGACGGSAPLHSGYPSGENEPWTSAENLRLRENGEAWTEGTISYPKRERAKWYVLDLPAPGKLVARLKMDPRTTGADVGIEILDAGYNIVVKGQNDDDLGQNEKLREVAEARAGKTYIHIFALSRQDVADYRLAIRWEPKPTASGEVARAEPPDSKSAFPATVPNLPPLPAVPEATPGRHRVAQAEKPKEPEPVEKPVEKEPWDDGGPTVRGVITEFGTTSRGVRIVINKGSASGVDEGWVGYVVDAKTKRSLPKGSFTVKKTKDQESEGIVNLTLDQVQQNRTVVLKAPK